MVYDSPFSLGSLMRASRLGGATVVGLAIHQVLHLLVAETLRVRYSTPSGHDLPPFIDERQIRPVIDQLQ